MSTRGSTRGVVYVHSSPSAVCPHVEWAISGTLGARVDLKWTAQPASPGQLRAECGWRAPAGTGAKLASALKAWPMIRFEVTEEPSAGVDGERFCFAPGLGLWHGRTSANGDIVVGEDQLRALVSMTRGGESLAHKLDELLAASWDEALEPYRHAGDGAPVTWLHQVG
ncbi:hypothetical protein AMES_2080 [Amycolatopsis mediterranei S699]|uniref:DUF3145 domain-containing protein n=1 Tax=Amycolatopsis mediterranei (strain U-32) TaxID=749927 RepID=A0A0H3CZX3_AMYMU|nr:MULTISPECIES: DUF3145 domain-containing protein [Amycolatopsis]ADJ43903.1 conserved hypothetical protein [Amycolatopsis mediterranei U32]AFO75616.1 hypothetical protein AMES_2080 [Amycolatopsis mediterranei S699]AGT82745.1 hypothetical protein B737_2081 [Amycolatopsis mediterranei RB]KDO09089.1 hypothetical protein DV26_19180 [Amycolatopsis mediterranei]KDU92833.1 hypothetical protein DV36_07265 [Amycolatopsis mediterranei]